MVNTNRNFADKFTTVQKKPQVSLPDNALNRRMRRMTRALLEKENREMQRPAICRLRRASWQEWVKLIVGLFCLGIFLYQDYDRIVYYLSVPVAVDVSIVQQEEFTFPAVTVCFTDYGQLTNLLLTSEQREKLMSCDDETNKTGQQAANISNVSFWKGRKDINASWIVAQLEPNLPVKLENVIILPQGVCTTFYADSAIKFRRGLQKLKFELTALVFKCGPFFPRLFCTHLPEEKPHHKDFLGILGFRGADYGIGVTKYKFLNRRQKPCSDVSEYWECIEKCQTSRWQDLIPCRYHYLSPELSHFPLCNSRRMFCRSLATSMMKMATLDPDKQCKCVQPCKRTVFKMNYRPRPKSEKVQRLTLFFEDDYITTIEERNVYGFIALVCDVGGIMGLYLGWSLLSIMKLVQILLPESNGPIKKKEKSWAKDPIYNKVSKHYNLLLGNNKQRFASMIQQGSLMSAANDQTPFRYVKHAILVLCIVSCVYVSYDKIALYLSNPIMITVEVHSKTEVEFPNLTYCQDINATIDYKQQLAEARNLNSSCEVDFLDLLDVPGMTISKLWEISLTDAPISLNKDYSTRRIQVLGESCVEASIGRQVHKGRTMFEQLQIMPQCGVSQKERRISPLLTNCISAEKAKECKQECLQKRMLETLKCRFPKMAAAYDAIPLCSSSKAAKEARATYIDIMVSTDTVEDCNCQRECHKIIFESDIFVIPGRPSVYFGYPLITMRAGFRDPDRQIYTELPFYTTTKLFCDIGGILGLLLGFSFMEFMDILISVTSNKFGKYFG